MICLPCWNIRDVIYSLPGESPSHISEHDDDDDEDVEMDVVFDDNGDDGNSGKADDSQYLVSLILVLSVLPSCSPHAIAQHIISPYYQSSVVIVAVDYVENNDDGSECDDFPNTSSRSYRSCPESFCCTTYYFPHTTLCCQQLI